MIWFFYNVLFVIGFTLLLPRFFWRMWRRGGYRQGFFQRLAVYGRPLSGQLRSRRRIWIHAVSVGEVYVAARFMEELRRRRPGTAFVLTTTTSTGHKIAGGVLKPDDVLLYFPVDVPPVIRRVHRLVNPEAVVLTECELWPNMIREARRRQIPVFLINGRISDRSYRGYRLVRAFFRRTVAMVDRLFVQTAADADRLIRLGAEKGRVEVLGSAKYDVAQSDPAGEAWADRLLQSLGVKADAPVMVGGSTWPGEEMILVDIAGKLRADQPGVLLVLVPRHAERGDAVAAELRERGVRFVRRSEMGQPGFRADSPPEVLLVDTTGELKNFYARATAIFVGKSLTQHGGQNVIEPALYGRPVVVGPNMENFAGVMADFLEAEAMVQVRDAAELGSALARLLRDPSLGTQIGQRARQVVEKKRGSVAATVDRILPRLSAAS